MELALVLTLVLSTSPSQARANDRHAETDPATRPSVFVGRVLTPDGRPALGALVTTSAGGQVATAMDGSFALAVGVPAEAESVDVNARTDRGDLSAHIRVVPASLAPTTSVGALLLEPSTSCRPGWRTTFGGRPGTYDVVRAFAVFDDGAGPALYTAGDFVFAGGVEASRVARWSGSRWSALGSGMDAAKGQPVRVYALAVFDDGSGDALYAAGDFASAGGIAANNIARWDGASWTALGSGLNGDVTVLATFDDGSGTALYAGGGFTTAGGAAANRIARWDGTSWTALGSGMNASVYALTVFDDGGGPELYAAGAFTTAGGVAANRMARWDGTSWTALGSGMDFSVHALAVYDDGSGPALHAGGTFTTAGGVSALRIARWDGASWSALGAGTTGGVYALAVLDDGGGAVLYAGGAFAGAGEMTVNHMARWDGSTWSATGSGTDELVRALAVFDDGTGPQLYAGGDFTTAGGVGADCLARWSGAGWSTTENGLNGDVRALATFDGGGGNALYAGGSFTAAGGVSAGQIARWDGASWAALGNGVTTTSSGVPRVHALAAFGSKLHAGGRFTTLMGVAANHIASWDGTSWTPLASGLGNTVHALAVFDDGGGEALYVGGEFLSAGGIGASRMAKWDGTSWSALGSGIGGSVSEVHALVVFDDGTGPDLYAGGDFTSAGGVAANRIARWKGFGWSALGSGVGPGFDVPVRALAVFDDGTGPALYVGGEFDTAGGVAVNGIARWDGVSWSALGSGVDGAFWPMVLALAVFDDGSGPALYAGGTFMTAGGVAANHIARWDGTSWSALGAGVMPGWSDSSIFVGALSVFDDDSGPALQAGGSFLVSPARDSHLARWGCGKPRVRLQDW